MRSGLLIAIAVSLVACGEDPATRRRRAEATVLARQNENRREIIAATREKRLVDPRWLAVAVDEAAVKSVIEAGLPRRRWWNLEALQERVPPVAIPVRLRQNLAIDGLGDGPVQVDPGRGQARGLHGGRRVPARGGG